MTTPRIGEFAAFIKERHDIYLKRKAGQPGPWTADPILAGGRFCNVFRELDTVTIWIDQNIRKPYAGHEHLWLMLALARYINWPDTLATLIEAPGAWPSHEDFKPSNVSEVLAAKASLGDKVYTGAYMIRAESDQSKEWYSWSKHRYIAEIVIGRLWEDRAAFVEVLEGKRQASLEQVWKVFQEPRYIGWGPFMAYEVVTDLRHTRYLNEAPDIYSWANAGPGAIRGLNRLHGRDLGAKPKPEATNQEMFELMNDLNDWAEPGFTQTFGPRLDGGEDTFPRFEMRDIEHCLCEFDKYERVKLGEGKMRSKYDWRKATTI